MRLAPFLLLISIDMIEIESQTFARPAHVWFPYRSIFEREDAEPLTEEPCFLQLGDDPLTRTPFQVIPTIDVINWFSRLLSYQGVTLTGQVVYEREEEVLIFLLDSDTEET